MAVILDSAEARFAENGYNGVSLNEVAAAAGVPTSLMRYYFGDKKSLFRAVFLRRGPAINAARRAAMADYRTTCAGRPDLEGMIAAFTRPAFEKMASDQGWRNYMAIVAYVNSSRGFLHDLMAEVFDHVSQELLADLRNIFPNAADEEIYYSYHFLTGAFTFSLGRTGRIDGLSNGRVSSENLLEIADRLPVAMAAAIRAICSRPASK